MSFFSRAKSTDANISEINKSIHMLKEEHDNGYKVLFEHLECLEKSIEKLSVKQKKQDGTLDELYAIIEEHVEAFDKKENIRGNEWKLIQVLIQYDDFLNRTAALLNQSEENSKAACQLIETGDFLTGQLKELSLFCIGRPGELIDYRLHEVIDCTDTNQPDMHNKVCKTVMSGWRYGDKLIRKAQVTAWKFTEDIIHE